MARQGAGAGRLGPGVGLGGIALVLCLLGTAVSLPAAPAGPTIGPHTLVALPANGPCPGTVRSAFVNGTLGVMGNETPRPAVGGVNLTFGFDYQVTVTTRAGSSAQCDPGVNGLTTGPGGRFSHPVALPTGGCNSYSCTTYTGPFGPETLQLTGPDPPAYMLRGSVTSPLTELWFVAVFDHLAISPPGPKTLSVGAPTRFWAVPTAADGTPSPALWNASWSVGATGWSLANSTGNSTTLVGPPGVGPTTLTLQVNASWQGQPVPGHTASIAVNAIPTIVSAASVAPTRLDAGAPTTFTIDGSGAYGYNYSATVDPGLGFDPVTGNCSSVSATYGEVELYCSVSVTFTEAGTTTPSGNITNRYSTGGKSFPELTVAPALELTVAPDPVLGYAGDPVAVAGSVTDETGTGPFGPACFDDGAGALACSNDSGPSWSFAPRYGGPGNYTGRFSVLDAAGVNASRTVSVVIGTRPMLSNMTASPGAIAPGASSTLESVLFGGVGTLTYWWNDSNPAATMAAGTRSGPGELTLAYVARTDGEHWVTLTVIDALGSKTATEVPVYVLPGPATAIGSVPGTVNASWQAGVPQRFTLVALAPDGERVPEYGAPVFLNWSGGALDASAFFVNSSVLGPVAVGAGPSVELPGSAWFAGYLNFTVTALTETSGALAFGGPLPVQFAGGSALEIRVTAELGDLRLTAPTVAAGGARDNRTLWRLIDPFGNAAPDGFVTIDASFGGTTVSTNSTIRVIDGAALVWINYSAPTASAGTVTVRSEWGELLLGPVSVPAAAANGPLLLGALAAGSAVAFTGLFLVVTRRRPESTRGPEIDAEELREDAEGRDRLLDRVRAEGPIALDELLEGGPPPRPDRIRAGEWLASLITEGLVRPRTGSDGVARLEAVTPSVLAFAPRVDLDPSALDRALADSSASGEDEAAGVGDTR
ncbi:MAG TPA: hypothetical protein VGV89_09650 [Thermoplasmata archaeon]|nr:hypothetical protein [Thermoplasmata archaeon]